MRKAKTPPKRKPVMTGRRAAKRKAAKGSRAKVAKVAPPGDRAQAARQPAGPLAGDIVGQGDGRQSGGAGKGLAPSGGESRGQAGREAGDRGAANRARSEGFEE